MKKLYKYASALILTGALSVMVVLNADAQRGGAHASGGGGSAGGGGGTFTRASGGGGGGFRGSVGFGTGLRSGLGLGLSLGYRSNYGFYGYPSLGFYLNTLPYGYYPFYMGPSLFYYSNGIFYRPYGDDEGYVVTAPPVGAAVPQLPSRAKSIMIDNQQYFEYNGVYYKIVINDKGDKVYVVAGKDGVLNTDNATADDAAPAPHVGDIVNRLPDHSRVVTLNNKKYYVGPDEIYYEVITDNNGNTAYRIASVPE